MANCFSYSFIKCENASGDRTLDAIFTPLQNIDIASMFQDPQASIDRATSLAYNAMVNALISKEGESYDKHNIILGDRFIESYSSVNRYEILTKGKQFVKINRVHVNVQYTGTINIRIENELGQVQLVPVVVVSGITTTKEIDISHKRIEITINEAVQGRSIWSSGVSGLLVDYSILCDYDSYICNNKAMFQNCMDYKVASIVLTDGVFAGEINQRIMQRDDYDKLKAEYEIEYERELDKLNLRGSGCFECGSRIKVKSWIDG